MSQDTLTQELFPKPQSSLRSGFSPGSMVLLTGVVLFGIVIGVALSRQLKTQPTSGPAPDFTLTTFEGDTFRLSEQRGKVVIVNFWASWCGPCRDEAPILQNLWEKYRDRDVILVGVAYADNERESLAFIEEFGITYPNGPDIGTRISDDYRITGVPETFVVDQEGNVAAFIIAPVRPGQLDAMVDDLLQPAEKTENTG